MNTPMPAEIKEGDRLKWRFPNGVEGRCTVYGIKRICDRGVDILTDYVTVNKTNSSRMGVFCRSIDMEWLTKYNGRKITNSSSLEQQAGVDSGPEAREAEQIDFSYGR